LERDKNVYYQGVQLSGSNAHLLSVISKALNASGFGIISTIHDSSKINQSEPDWLERQHGVQMIVGRFEGVSALTLYTHPAPPSP
jgi:hypothetical protein